MTTVTKAVPSDKLIELSSLCTTLRVKQRQAENLAEELKKAEAEVRALTEEDIPSLMAELGVRQLKLEDGSSVSIADEVFASIPVANRPAAHLWLTSHGHDGIIKTEVSLAFGRGKLGEAEKVAFNLREQGFDVTMEQAVHPQTLRAFLREQLEKGADVPLELFGARPVKYAKIKTPKEPK